LSVVPSSSSSSSSFFFFFFFSLLTCYFGLHSHPFWTLQNDHILNESQAKYVPQSVNSKIHPFLIFKKKRELELLFWSKSSIILGLFLVANKTWELWSHDEGMILGRRGKKWRLGDYFGCHKFMVSETRILFTCLPFTHFWWSLMNALSPLWVILGHFGFWFICAKRNVAKDVQTNSLFADNFCFLFFQPKKRGENFRILLFS
jgi:hypothetical protein